MGVGAWVENAIKKGEIKEHGHFLDGTSGYTFWEGEATDIFRNLSMTVPYYDWEIHEIVPYEKSREIIMAVFIPRIVKPEMSDAEMARTLEETGLKLPLKEIRELRKRLFK